MNAVDDTAVGSAFALPSLAQTPMRFWDRNKHLSWLKATIAARRISSDPNTLSHLRRHLDAWRKDPRNALTIRIWDVFATTKDCGRAHKNESTLLGAMRRCLQEAV